MNGIGYESGNGLIADMHRALPWLQDTTGQDVWTRWQPEYRDLVIVDGTGRKVEVFNLTVHNLDVPAEVDALRTLLRDVASR